METTVEVVKKFCRYYEDGDKESYLKLCDDDLVWASTRQDGGMCRGKKQMFDEYLPQFYSQFDGFASIYEEFLDAGQDVIALGRYKITSKTGEKFESPFAQIYTVKDGKIVKFRQYADSATIQKAIAPTRLHDSSFSGQQNFTYCICGHKYALPEMDNGVYEFACPNCGRKMRIGKMVVGRVPQTDRLAGVDPSSLYPIIKERWKNELRIDKESDASALVGYCVRFPSRLPPDYSLQLGVVVALPDGGKDVFLYYSKVPITDLMRWNEFFAQKGIILHYRKENTDSKGRYGFESHLQDYVRFIREDGVDASEVSINGNMAMVANERDRMFHGCKVHDPSQVEFVMDKTHVTIKGYFAKEELVAIAESIK